MTKRRFGNLRKLPSGRWQARYTGPDLREHKGPRTWEARDDAIAWIRSEERLIEFNEWRAPDERDAARVAKSTTVADYAKKWTEQRTLKPSTRSQYESYYRSHLVNTVLGTTALNVVSLADVREWLADLQTNPPSKSDGTTRNARVYAWLRTVLASAVDDKLIDENPCRIKGAGTSKRQRAIVVPTPTEVTMLASHMPARLQLLPQLAAWCALRRGELLGLRRADVSPDASTITVRKAVTFVNREAIEGSPKNDRQRVVAVPPHLAASILDHLETHVAPGRRALLFPFTPGDEDVLTDGQLRHYWESARATAGLEHVRLHDLRHAGSMWAASSGATVPELQRRLGHESTAAAIRYMHAANGSDRAIADRLSELVTRTEEEDE